VVTTATRFLQEIQRWQHQRAQTLGFEQAEGAAVSFSQRFGSSLNLNIHWHLIVPDAVFLPEPEYEHLHTLPLPAPTRLELEEVVTTVLLAPSAGWRSTATFETKARIQPRTPTATRRGCAAYKAAWAWGSSSAGPAPSGADSHEVARCRSRPRVSGRST